MCTKILSSPLIFSRIKTADMISVLRMGPWIFVVVPCFSCLPLTLTMQFPDSIFCSQSKRTKMSQDHFPKSAYPSLVNVCNRCTGDSRKNRHRWVEPTHNGQSWGGGGHVGVYSHFSLQTVLYFGSFLSQYMQYRLNASVRISNPPATNRQIVSVPAQPSLGPCDASIIVAPQNRRRVR